MSAAQMEQAVIQRALTWVSARNASLLEFESKLERGARSFCGQRNLSLMHSKSLKTCRPSLQSSSCWGGSETLGRSSWAFLMSPWAEARTLCMPRAIVAGAMLCCTVELPGLAFFAQLAQNPT